MPDCSKPVSARGYCSGHYHRLVRHGDPAGGPRKPYNRPWQDRFWERVTKLPDGCWEFDGSPRLGGYATFEISAGQSGTGKRRSVLAHRLAWEIEHGAPPDDELDHTCYNRICVKIAHLESVDHDENLRRGNEQRRREREALRVLGRLHPELLPTL